MADDLDDDLHDAEYERLLQEKFDSTLADARLKLDKAKTRVWTTACTALWLFVLASLRVDKILEDVGALIAFSMAFAAGLYCLYLLRVCIATLITESANVGRKEQIIRLHKEGKLWL